MKSLIPSPQMKEKNPLLPLSTTVVNQRSTDEPLIPRALVHFLVEKSLPHPDSFHLVLCKK